MSECDEQQKMLVYKVDDDQLGDCLFRLIQEQEECFSDVKVRSEDGHKFECHRAALVSRSAYFRCLFSSGLQESAENVVTLNNVSFSTLSILLEFIYTCKCEVSYDEFIDIVIAADMTQMTDLLNLLMDEFNAGIENEKADQTKRQRDQEEAQDRALIQEDVNGDVTKLILEMWILLQRIPSLATTLICKNRKSIKECVQTALPLLKKSRHVDLIREFELDEFCRFLSDLELGADESYNDHLLFWIPAWISADYDSRISFLELFLHESFRRFDRVPGQKILDCWSATMREPDVSRALALKNTMSQPLLILPYGQGPNIKFLAHDIHTTETFYIPAPTLPSGYHLLGQPQLVACDAELYCVQAAHVQGKNSLFYVVHRLLKNGWDQNPCIKRFRHPGPLRRWQYHKDFEHLHSVQGGDSTLVVEGFMTPPFLPLLRHVSDFSEAQDQKTPLTIPIIQRSYMKVNRDAYDENDLKNKNDDDGVASNGRLGVQNLFSDGECTGVGDRAPIQMHFVSVFSFGANERDTFKGSTRNDNLIKNVLDSWEIMAPKQMIQLVGASTFAGDRNRPAAFVNILNAQGNPTRSLILSEHSSFQSQPKKMPNGLQSAPLSIANVGEYTFSLDCGPRLLNSNLLAPRLSVMKVQELPYSDEIPTPSFPDINFGSIFYNWTEKKLYLVLVQNPKSSQLLTENTATMNSLRLSNDSPERQDGRILGFFRTKMEATELAIHAGRRDVISFRDAPVDQVWESLPVSEATADFLSLGCFLPSEVRITPAIVDSYHFEQVSLLSRRHEDDCVIVDFQDHKHGKKDDDAAANVAHKVDSNDDKSFKGEMVENIGPHMKSPDNFDVIAVGSAGCGDGADKGDVSVGAVERDIGDGEVKRDVAKPLWTMWQESTFSGETCATLEPGMNLCLDQIGISPDYLNLRQSHDRQFQIELKPDVDQKSDRS